MNVVIYARFSCQRQTEQSIEGQLKVCYEYASAHNYTVVGEYIDRAQSGTSDNRLDFQRMIADSEKHTFEGVLVYQLDRFARNRYDSAIYKSKLKKNGVRVLSAKENITEDASGILVEGLLESMAEYYSVELAQKINRGLAINAEKCLSNGSNPGLGFKVNKKDRTFYVDEEEAAIVREIYERYARGEPKVEIMRDLNRRHIKTSIGNEFSFTSLTRLLSNKRYIGYYIYSGKETPGGMPRIIEDDLFYRVQDTLNRNKHAQGRTKGDDAYILTTKLFCGHCKEMMVGVCGTGKSGGMHIKEITQGGADVVIDCVGMDGKMSVMEKVETALKLQAGSKSAIEISSEAVRKCGTVAMVGVYGGRYNTFPLGNFFSRNVTLKMGQCPAHAYIKPILEMIKKGEFDATDIITHKLSLDEGSKGYSIFDNKEDGCIKVILKP